jgi:nicotinate-nucleotide adenylyltransferase
MNEPNATSRPRSDAGRPTSDLGPIGVLGGTLDPIHCGHLAAAAAARDAFDLPRVLVVPSHVPPHRPVQPIASPFHRFAMAALAVSGMPRVEACDDELRAEGPSYTADTLERLHARGYAPAQIFFITGADAFAEIGTWKRYPEVLDLAHFVVVSRPGYESDALVERLPDLRDRMRPAGAPARADASTLIFLLQAATPDVSSTAIRQRLQRGASLNGLVPPLVETHIRQHHLYPPPPEAAHELHGQS